ncbi:MAG: PAS domain S-box protein [Verrucomicrobia bacterium]|nr:PAS domain S-box protein [Verrucomicrobiota bacterium]
MKRFASAGDDDVSKVRMAYVSRIALRAAGIIMAALGFVALLGWAFKLPLFASFGIGLIPMAPITAISFLLYGIAIGCRAEPPESRRIHKFGAALVGVATGVAFFIFVQGFFNVHWSGERLGLNLAGTGVPASSGHMSPVTSVYFLLAGISFAASFSPLRLRSGRAAFAFIATGMLLTASFVFLMAYAFGTPLLYGGRFIPPALNTVLAFVTLGVALLILAGRSASLFDGSPTTGAKTAFHYVLIFFLLVAVILTTSYSYYRSYEKNYRIQAGHKLLAINDLKVNELIRWRKERLEDGSTFFNNSVFSALVRRLFEQPKDQDAEYQVIEWLKKYWELDEYDQIRLLTPDGVTHLSLPADAPPATVYIEQGVSDVLKSGRVAITDFYRHDKTRRIYLSVLIPIFEASDTHTPLGVLALRIDPSTYLYPVIQHWPVPSATAETLLVRRDGNEAVFLNELRFQSNTALSLRYPLSETNLPAVKAVLGQAGIIEGRDYRGKPVFAAVSAIPGSPWFMVARQDKSEVFAPLWSRLWQVTGMIGVLLFGATGLIGIIWRQQRVVFYRERAQSADALRKTNDYLENLINYANAPIIVWDPQMRITRFNHVFEKLSGRLESEMLGQSLETLVPPRQAEETMALISKTLSGERWEEVEIPILNASGLVRTVLWNSATLFAPNGKTPIATIAQGHDITMRKESEQHLAEAAEQLRVSNRDLEQFAYIASHDLQEPLRMVANYMQLLERRYSAKLDQDARDFIGYAVDGAVRMQQLIDSLLEYSRLQSRKKPFEPVDLNMVLERVVRDLEGRILETGTKVTADPLPQVVGDAVQLGQVLQNFISNALKFRGEAPPEIHIAAEELSNHWKVTVRDNGIGIAPEHQERIFKIFQRLHSRAEYPGTGIGLAICRRIIERHGGETGVESESRKGSVFWFTLPKKGTR